MMKVRSRIVALILSSILICMLCVVGACNDKRPELVFEVPEFYETELGRPFELPEVTAKADNVDYVVTYVIKDEEGNQVNAQISPNDFMTYTVEFTVVFFNENVTKTMELRVVDRTPPTISVAKQSYLAVLETTSAFTIPTDDFTFKDASAKKAEDITVNYSVTYDGSQVTLDSNLTFALSQAGEYVITIQAKDQSNNTATKTVPVKVFNTLEEVINIGFEDEADINRLYGYEDEHWQQSLYYIKPYSELSIGKPEGGGDYCLQYSPSQNDPGGMGNAISFIIIDLGVVIPKDTVITFQYYYKKPDSYTPTNVYLKVGPADVGSDLPEGDRIAKFNEDGKGGAKQFNTWITFEYTAKTDMDRIEFEMWATTGHENLATEIFMFVDNIKVKDAGGPVLIERFDFENDDELDCITPYDGWVDTEFDVVEYKDINVPAPEGGGNSCLWFAPTASNPGNDNWTRAAIAIDFGAKMPAGTPISFMFYYQKPASFDPDVSFKVGPKIDGDLGDDTKIMDAPINNYGGYTFNTWHYFTCRLDTEEQFVKFEVYSYTGDSDGTQIELYIDCISILEGDCYYSEFHFENNDELFKVDGDPEGEWTDCEWDIASYQDLGIDAPEGGGQYCLWYNAALNNPEGNDWSRADIKVDFGKPLPKGTVVYFKYYVNTQTAGFTPDLALKVGKSVNDLADKYKVAEFGTDKLDFNKWYTLNFTLDEDLSVIKFETYIVAPASNDKTKVKIYVDDIVIGEDETGGETGGDEGGE